MPLSVHFNGHGWCAEALSVDDNCFHYALFFPFPVISFRSRNHFAFINAHNGAKAKLARGVRVARERAPVPEAQALAQ